MYSPFTAFQRSMASSHVEPLALQSSQDPLMYSFERNMRISAVGHTVNPLDQNSHGSEALPTLIADTAGQTGISPIMPSVEVDTTMEMHLPDEGYACCPICFTAFESSSRTSISRLSCGTISTYYEFLTQAQDYIQGT